VQRSPCVKLPLVVQPVALCARPAASRSAWVASILALVAVRCTLACSEVLTGVSGKPSSMLGSCASFSFAAASRSAATFKSTATFSARRAASDSRVAFVKVRVVKFIRSRSNSLFSGVSSAASVLAAGVYGAARPSSFAAG
jgi:hypothetical protein